MILISNDFEKDILAFSSEWFELCSVNRLVEACALLDAPNSYGVCWNPQSIVDLINDTFPEGCAFRNEHPSGISFTAPSCTTGKPEVSIGKFDSGDGFWLEHSVPLNGVWSDITAEFEFLQCGELYNVVLHDLHVL